MEDSQYVDQHGFGVEDPLVYELSPQNQPADESIRFDDDTFSCDEDIDGPSGEPADKERRELAT